MLRLKKITEFTQLEKIKLFTALGVILTVALGTINHFVYEWTGENKVLGLFVATNESQWEHIKLALLPMFLIFLVGGFIFRDKVNNYYFAVFCALSVTILFIVLAFMGYTTLANKSIFPIDLSIFIAGITLGYLTAYRIFFIKPLKYLNYLAILGILFILGLFLTCTYHAPNLFVFQELYVEK